MVAVAALDALWALSALQMAGLLVAIVGALVALHYIAFRVKVRSRLCDDLHAARTAKADYTLGVT
jgi:hypothetical protein